MKYVNINFNQNKPKAERRLVKGLNVFPDQRFWQILTLTREVLHTIPQKFINNISAEQDTCLQCILRLLVLKHFLSMSTAQEITDSRSRTLNDLSL